MTPEPWSVVPAHAFDFPFSDFSIVLFIIIIYFYYYLLNLFPVFIFS